MTVVVGVKVFDGLVIAADSATTLQLPDGSHQVYNNANKIFHLHRKYPVAAATWGLGVIGSASISTLAKDLRRRFMGADSTHADWALQDDYTIRGVAERLRDFMFDELYAPQVSSGQQPPSFLGLLVAGYQEDPGQGYHSEIWTLGIEDPTTRPMPQLEAGGVQVGWVTYAIQQAVMRLFNGFDPDLPAALHGVTDPGEHVAINQVLDSFRRQPVPPAMPFADAIALARFLADTTIGYTHFLLGPDVVGGPVEVAGISRHEGFRWISRKHYYPADLNPKDPGHNV